MKSGLTVSETLDILSKLEHRPKKNLGQNFLVDKNIVHKSLELGNVRSGDHVIEIGPGLGTLTRCLLESGAGVWAVEKDKTLYNYLRESLLPDYQDKLSLLCGDALDYPLANFPGSDLKEFKIIANLPYAISTPWLEAVLGASLPVSMTLMLQKEAAERFIAKEGTKTFGAISIFLQAAYDVTGKHTASASCFLPKPKVGSLLLHVERKAEPFCFPEKALEFIRLIFTQRRKQLASVMRALAGSSTRAIMESWLAHLGSQGFPATVRAEQVPVTQWMVLGELFASSK